MQVVNSIPIPARGNGYADYAAAIAAALNGLGIDISAQTIGNIAMNMAAQTIGVQLQEVWQTGQGNQKIVTLSSINLAAGATATQTYTVTAGKKLFIFMWSGSGVGNPTAGLFSFTAQIIDNTASATLFAYASIYSGQYGGSWYFFGYNELHSFNIPLIVPGGHVLKLSFTNYLLSGVHEDAWMQVVGFEV